MLLADEELESLRHARRSASLGMRPTEEGRADFDRDEIVRVVRRSSASVGEDPSARANHAHGVP